MPIAPDDLRVAMRYWATGVTIVTAADDESLCGMTVTSFTSVSLEPPLVLVSIERGTHTYAGITQSGAFAVSVLAHDQKEWSMRFGGQAQEVGEADRFLGIPTQALVTGSPILIGASAYLDCQVTAAYEVGTHTIFIGEVVASGVDEGESRPLLYYRQNYRFLADE